MDGLEAFLDTYGVAAACAIMLVKAAGVPVPIPGDVILLATAARAAEGKVVLWLAFGATVQHALHDERRRRLFSIVMGTLLALSVALIVW